MPLLGKTITQGVTMLLWVTPMRSWWPLPSQKSMENNLLKPVFRAMDHRVSKATNLVRPILYSMTRANGSKFHQTSDICLDSRRFVPSRSHWSSNTLGFVWKWDTPKSHGASSFSPFRWFQMAHILASIPHEITSHMPPQPNFSEAVWFNECQSVSSGLISRSSSRTSDDKFSWMYPLVN